MSMTSHNRAFDEKKLAEVQFISKLAFLHASCTVTSRDYLS